MNRRELLILTAAAPGLAQNNSWKPKLFDAHQNETVVALTELIIPATDTPGAKAALVNRYIDLLLNDGPAGDRDRFMEGLAFLDGHAIRKHQQPFVRCTAAQQTAILEEFDKGSGSGNRFFRQAKQLTSRIYYATQIGYAELNKGGRVPSTYGCAHPEHKA
ncbi:MAG: gluconate 2-dehydrogenase subunit 3 family protein [Candidatus Solibacter usitatus]|nr:gluconate 2-dehydrogenase subunit 3 family protein [Candidatus Solibacter usitatus]